MNKLYTLFIGVAAAVCVTSCEPRQQIEGSWTATMPEKVSVMSTEDATIKNTIEFTPDAKNNKTGTIYISSTIDLVGACNADTIVQGAVAPYQFSVSGVASISGTYTFDDDDELFVALNDTTLYVGVDPDKVVYGENLLTQQQAPTVRQMQYKAVNDYSRQLNSVMLKQYARFGRIDDIKVKENNLKFELGHEDFVYTRNPQ